MAHGLQTEKFLGFGLVSSKDFVILSMGGRWLVVIVLE